MSVVLQGVHKAFGSKRVLTGVDLEARDGETLAVVGGSGVGKSVLLKHVVRLIQPDQGEVWVGGERVADLDDQGLLRLRRQVGYVFQFAALFDSMTIADNVAMGLRRVSGADPAAVADRVRRCLEVVDLEGYGDRYPAELSGGQRKRAGLARAIATEPSVLLYDEPTTGLDPITTTVIDRLILRMRDDLGVTGIVITHDMKSAFRVADRIAMLYDGRIRFSGTGDELQACEDPIVRGFVQGLPELVEG